ncbi:MAG: TadE/TadG family type IV pilus assembly protein [Acidimicrobiales bacterium]
MSRRSEQPRRRTESERDRGAALVISAIAMTVLLGLGAIAVDFAAVRNNRTNSQRASDSAAAAAALSLIDADPQVACSAALDYLALNGVNPTPTTPVDCSTFPTTCVDGTTASTSASMSDTEFLVTLTYPVDNGDLMMNPSALGAGGQALVAADGSPCDRFGVSVQSTHATFFAGILGSDEVDTTVHSVARATIAATGGRAINLLLLERADCNVLEVAGSGGGTGGISVGPVTDPATGEIFPGTISLDSNGTGAGCGSAGTIDVVGSNSVVQANGETGCATELVPGTGEGCGLIELIAPGTPGCNPPACVSSGTVAPEPTRARSLLTRAPIDWIYNCKSSYPVAYDIRGCKDAATTPAYIDQLVAAIGTSGLPTPAIEWNDYSPTYPCSISGGPSTVVTVPEGNWRVNCNLSINRTLVFEGGNIVFDGDVSVGSSGTLDINGSNGTTFYQPPDDVLVTHESSDGAAFVYLRNGLLSKSGQASLRLHNTLVYVSDTSEVSLGGGSGALEILAPTQGPFTNLAMWSESTADHQFGGQAAMALEGVFFTPLADVRYQGNGAQQQVAAQFIALTLKVGGNGRLDISPRYDRLVTFPDSGTISMIR